MGFIRYGGNKLEGCPNAIEYDSISCSELQKLNQKTNHVNQIYHHNNAGV